MAPRKNLTVVTLLALLASACVTQSGTSAAGDDGATTDTDVTGTAPTGTQVTDPSGSTDPTPTSQTPVTPTSNTTPVYPTQHPRIYLTPNRTRLVAALNAKTSAATRFKGLVDQWIAGSDIWGFSAWNAALLGQLTGNATYCTKAVATVEAQVVAAEAKIAINQAPVVAGDSYLEIGDLIGDLALVYDWCYAQTSSAQRTRWLKYADQAVSNVWHPTTAKWGNATLPWSGWATNDPSDNYYYSFLRATMLLGLASKGEDPQADLWITQFHDTKIQNQLVPTFNADLVGGGSREGTGYGVAMRRLFELYDLWQATTGEALATKTGHSRQSLLAMLHQLVPTRDRVAPTGDLSRDSTAAFFDYHRNYLQELIQQFPTDTLARRAKTQLLASSLPSMGSQFMLAYDFLYDDSNVSAQPVDGLNPTYYAAGIGELYTRSGWDAHATWVNLIAGPYTQSHAHQDQGSLMIYKDGWLAYDAVIDSHSGLTQETTAHGLVRIDSGGQPVRQIANTISRLTALHQGAGYTHAAADLTAAYNGNTAVQKVQRELVHLLPDVVVVFDRVQSAAGTQQTWQLASPAAASISGATATVTASGHALKIQKISGGTMSVTAMTSVNTDFAGGYRLDEKLAGGDNRYLHVLSIDGSVSSTTSAGDSTHPGVTVHLTNGHNATVTFNRDTAGATLVLDGVTKALGATVDSLTRVGTVRGHGRAMHSIRYAVVLAVVAACGGGASGGDGGDGGGGSDPPSYSGEHPRIYLSSNRDRLETELASGRPAATRFKSTVDRWVGGADIYGLEAWNAALVGQLTGDAKYCAAAVKAIDAEVTAAQQAIRDGSAPDVADDSYLAVGDLIGDLALTYDWCYSAIPGGRRAAWLAYANQAVWNVWNYKAATWGTKQLAWSGWAVDDPSDNYYYSFLRATMLLGLAAHDEIPDAAGWLIQFHDTKLIGELVPTFDADLVGGGSREGTGYGVSMRRLFHLYDLWNGSTGEVVADRTGHTRASMLSFIHQTVPTLDRIAPTGDHSRDSTAALFDYHRDYLQELVSLFPRDPLAPRAQALLAASSVPEMANQFMYGYDFLYDRADVAPTSLEGLGTAYHAVGIGELYARSGWDKHATWINLIAGPFTQSHAHQDQGSLLIYKDGWLAYDANVDSKSGLSQQLDAHSLVRITDGGKTVEQQRDTDSPVVALHTGDGYVYAAADLTPAYKKSAVVQKVQREIVYLEPDAIVVYDRVATRVGSQQIWQLATPAAPAIAGTRTTITAAGHTLAVERVAPVGAAASSFDFRSDADFTGGYRLDETIAGGDNRFLHVIFIDGAVGTLTPGTDSATITVGGKTVTVQFNHDSLGGKLTIAGHDTTLAAGVDTLPE